MPGLKDKLNRMKNHIVRDQPEPGGRAEALGADSVPFFEMWEKAGVSLYDLDGDYCLIREVRYPLETKHGKYAFRDYFDAIKLWQQKPVRHPLSAKGYSPSDLFFFDTETTGLGGGAGNTIFLLGYASFTEENVILKQHILPEPGLEVPLYYSFLENIDYTALVTYNGKAFDWPQVKTRHTLIRDHVPRLPEFGHFDLYHAAKRLWKDELGSVKLANVEREILGVERKEDIPGYLAPMIYFDFVERKNPEGLLGVIRHNEEDILSLISLYTHLTFQILEADPDQTAKEKRLVGKWFEYIGEDDAAVKSFEAAAGENDLAAKHRLAFQYKKQKAYRKAGMLWAELAEKAPDTIRAEACIELSKLYEHKEKDLLQAVRYAEKGLEIYQKYGRFGYGKWKKCCLETEKRLLRLYRKAQIPARSSFSKEMPGKRTGF